MAWCVHSSPAGLSRSVVPNRRAVPCCTGPRCCSWRSSASTRSTSCRPWRRSYPTTWRRSPMRRSESRSETGHDETGHASGGNAEAGQAERRQKVMAAAGVGSRRVCENLIAAGRVTVDGRTATLGDRADPMANVIHVDGERIVTDPDLVYLAMNKPRGVVTTMADEQI